MSVQASLRARRQARWGLTLIESLVVIGLMGVLAGLLLPAVERAREAARRAHCANNLRQLMQGVHEFENARGGFPPRVFTREFPSTTASERFHSFSTHVALLPYLEQSPLYAALNVEVRCFEPADLGRENATAARTVVAAFLCPSDPRSRSGPWAANSYRGNVGVDPFERDARGWLGLAEHGAFVTMSPVLPVAAFRDGLSNTLAFSEKPIGSGEAGVYSPFRDWVVRGGDTATGAEWARVCSSLTVADRTHMGAGGTWVLAGAIFTHFFASVPPNSPIPDCGTMTDMGAGVFAARSYHPGGVNAALADGSVRWFSSSTDPWVWKSLGTRSGGEAVTVPP